MERKEEIITTLGLESHPEGGYFKEIYRSQGAIPHSALGQHLSGARNHATSIYFLLETENFSAFHRIKQDEIWHFYEGAPVELHWISPEGEHRKHIIGLDLKAGQRPQLIVPAECWFAARVLDGEYSFVGCGVAPGFDFDDFELARREDLTAIFPQHAELIKTFTRA